MTTENFEIKNSYEACAYAEGFCEGANATPLQQLKAWAYIIKHGTWRTLQGWYGRTAHSLIEQGYITREGEITPEALDFIQSN